MDGSFEALNPFRKVILVLEVEWFHSCERSYMVANIRAAENVVQYINGQQLKFGAALDLRLEDLRLEDKLLSRCLNQVASNACSRRSKWL